MLIEQIRADILNAKKVKDFKKSTILSTLLSEAEKIGKDDGNRQTTDAEFIKVVKKFLSNIDETMVSLPTEDDRILTLGEERRILKIYLPEQLMSDELKKVVQEICNSLADRNPKLMGKVMNELKAKYDGLYDGKVASQLVKDILNS